MSVTVHCVTTTLHHRLQPHAVCFDVILGHGQHCHSRHGCHVPCFAVVCGVQAWACLSTAGGRSGLMRAASPRMDDLWPRLRRVCRTREH